MITVLNINSSLHGQQGQSSQLAREYVAGWQGAHPQARIITRDLAAQPLPHLDAERFGAFATPADKRTPSQAALVAESDALIAELKAADLIVLGLPMYNFGVPSTLKAYFDHVARAGLTFRYTDQGPEGLLRNKRAVVIATRGGQYAGTPKDTQSSYVRDFLAFLGIRDVDFVYAEGLAMGESLRQNSLQAAARDLEQLANAA